ncbi:MAG: glycosyltransferase family 2 protein [Chloroflexota bacterium]
MDNDYLVSILLPSWNTQEHSIAFLNSLIEQDYPLHQLEVVVVDNGSQDDSVDSLKKWASTEIAQNLRAFKLIELPTNRGIAMAYNIGYEHADPEAWAIIRAESDVVWESDLVSTLTATLRQHSIAGVVGAHGALYGKPQEIDHAARYINWWTGNMSNQTPQNIVECDCVFGPTFIIRQACIKRLGYFFKEDRFFADELAFCTRIKHAGYQVLYNPQARAFHKVAGSTSQLTSARFDYIAYFEKYLLYLEQNTWYRNISIFLYAALYALKHRKILIIHAMRNAISQSICGKKTLAPQQRSDMSIPEWLAEEKQALRFD